MPYVMNHFLDGNLTIGSIVIETPQPGQAAVTNGQSLADEAVLCKKNFQHNPTFLAVDFYDQGNAFQVAAVLNGITYVAKPLTGSTASGAAQPSKTGSSNPVSGISISFGSAAQVRPKSWGAVVVAGVVGVGAVWGLM
ncbi:hypothetical protein BC936DRAFT_137939 [Jimgerdemannia flammicorona]|uniref:Uncharacterized protein n=1 Tax=Jimgerdemannia flammicorona TaxID=994334 RepID=A0A433CWC4_9FUNG|nr:hypothetical protein BC936DRAFT_137939 [Jimgerdemannia flammicorona]